MAGDQKTDGDARGELLIGAPTARVNGLWDAGKVFVYDWDDIDDDDDQTNGDADGSPVREIVGDPVMSAWLGATAVAALINSNPHIAPNGIFIGRPGYRETVTTSSYAGGPTWPQQGPPIGGFQSFNMVRMAPGSPWTIYGTTNNARLGASVASLGTKSSADVDGDGALDFLIGQPGAKCQGRPYGAVSVLSTLERQISGNICGLGLSDRLGRSMALGSKLISSTEAAVVFTKRNSIYMLPVNKALDFTSLNDSAQYRTYYIGLTGNDTENSTANYNISLSDPFDHSTNVQLIAFGAMKNDQSGSNDPAVVGLMKVDTSLSPKGLTRIKEYRYSPTEVSDGYKFGSSVALISEGLFGGMDASAPVLLVGSPTHKIGTGNEGTVFLLGTNTTLTDGSSIDSAASPHLFSFGSTCSTTSSGTAVVSNAQRQAIGANDPLLTRSVETGGIGRSAYPGFGAFVMALPDFDGAGANDAYFLVSNSNMAHGTSDSLSEFFVFAWDKDYDQGGTDYCPRLKIIYHETGAAGAMLAANGRVMGDIDGDGVSDFMVSNPAGVGRYGNTGQVVLYSGAGMNTSTATDDILQKIYNPDPTASNFGISLEYADLNGNGLPDFVIGADKHNSGSLSSSGAMYVFPMESIKE